MDRLPPIPSPPGTIFREIRVNVVPFLVFAALVTLVVFQWRSYEGPAAIVGEAESRRTLVSSTVPGRLTRVLVAPLEQVAAGQAVAELILADPSLVEAQAELSKARIELARTAIEPRLRRDNNEINYLNLRLDWMRDRVKLADLRAQLAFQEFELDRVRNLQTTNGTPFPVASIFDVQVAERDRDSLRDQVAEQTVLVDELARAMAEFEPNSRKIDADLPSSVRAALAVEERALEAIEIQLRPVPLLAPMNGFVSMVHRHDGENILAGEPILTISADRSQHIVAYLRQPFTTEPVPGQKVRLRSRGRSGQSADSEILRTGTQLEPILPELLPQRPGGTLSIDPIRPAASPSTEYGLPILVAIPGGFRVLPGELVDLTLGPAPTDAPAPE